MRRIGLGWVLALALGCGGDATGNTGQTTPEDAGGSSAGGAAGEGGRSGSGGTAPGSGGLAATGGASSGGVTGTGGAPGAGGSAGFCPSAPPQSGAPCDPERAPSGGAGRTPIAHCAWGLDPRPECRTTALCQPDGTWLLSEGDDVACVEDPLPAACPQAPPDGGTVCDDAALECWYPEGVRCWCSDCAGGSPYPVCRSVDPPEWACAEPPEGCPERIPNAGEPCDVPEAQCGPDCDHEVVCADGVWHWQSGFCPICAAPDTPIATPTGNRHMVELSVGDLVYSVDDGAVAVVPILRVGSTRVAGHHAVRVTLEDGSVLEMSAGHPTGTGASFGSLRPGDAFDPIHRVRTVDRVPYEHERTYDILPDSSSGTYFAAGAWVGSTLRNQWSGAMTSTAPVKTVAAGQTSPL